VEIERKEGKHMRKILAILLSICLFTTAFIPCCAAEDSSESVSSFQLGEFSFEVPDGMEATRIGQNAYAVTISEDAAWAVVYAVDVSGKDSDSAIEAVAEHQQKFWDNPDAERYDETQSVLSLPGFDITFSIYTAHDGGEKPSCRMAGTFTDTWYVYTYCFESSESSPEYMDLFPQLITGATHSGKECRFVSEDANGAAEETATAGQRNALRSANLYLSVGAFSYNGLIKQLKYEGYTQEEAQYAADKCGADWMEQAAKSAETYLSLMGFSRAGLITQLEYEGYTHEQAVYGVEQNGL